MDHGHDENPQLDDSMIRPGCDMIGDDVWVSYNSIMIYPFFDT